MVRRQKEFIKISVSHSQLDTAFHNDKHRSLHFTASEMLVIGKASFYKLLFCFHNSAIDMLWAIFCISPLQKYSQHVTPNKALT